MKTADSLTLKFGRDFASGDVLFREGESGSQMFVIQSGSVRVTKKVGDQERTIAMLGRGEFIGEMAILNNKPRNATATVVEDASCLIVDAQTLETMITRNSEIAMRLVKKLAGRLDSADALVQILLNPDPKARVMHGLKRHAETYGEQADDGILLRITPDALANEVGANPLDVHNVLGRLQRLEIAWERPDEASIVIADVGRLLEFLEFLEEMPKKSGAV